VKLRNDIVVGVATHTGRVRNANEDDYLLVAPEESGLHESLGRWFGIADGMGGVTGGAEASRIAVRALCGLALREPELDPQSRMRKGFVAACQRVYASSKASSALREMGTTMTAINLVARKVILGHVGDSRCWLLRGGRLRLLTQDHVSHSDDHHLLRCIGGGREEEQVDVSVLELEKGDTLALATDGLWEAVPEPELLQILRQDSPQRAAAKLVQRANAGGGQDNATAVVIAYRGGEAQAFVEVDLPSEEAPEPLAVVTRVRNIAAPRWPWFLLAAAVLLVLAALGKRWFDVDVVRITSHFLSSFSR